MYEICIVIKEILGLKRIGVNSRGCIKVCYESSEHFIRFAISPKM